jgi:hypothetical protein
MSHPVFEKNGCGGNSSDSFALSIETAFNGCVVADVLATFHVGP